MNSSSAPKITHQSKESNTVTNRNCQSFPNIISLFLHLVTDLSTFCWAHGHPGIKTTFSRLPYN